MEPVPVHPLRLEALRAYYRRQLDRFESQTAKAKQRLSPEDVHDLRVSCRRLRAVLWLLRKSPLEGNGAFRKANRRLQELGQKLGELRTLDVAEADAKTLADEAHRKIKHLKAKKKKAAKDIKRSLGKKDIAALKKLLVTCEKRLCEMRTSDLQVAVGMLAKRLNTLSETVPRTPEARHRLRLDLKRVRYVLVALGSPIESLSELQDSLGKEHDLAVLRELVGADPALKTQRIQALSTTKKILKPTLKRVKTAMTEVCLPPVSKKQETAIPNSRSADAT